ncbi:hypothetical protein BYT27DRAFT_7213457 [Phlegmacium glaucopus]|nr:hypothetical protein BYT27DRAFT_7213457 [Phlegmacium glaucopus]
MATSDQCALGPDGTMLEPSEIIWFNDPDDPTPIPPIQQAGTFPTFPPKSPTIHPSDQNCNTFEEAYTDTKVMGDTDREALANRPKSDRTADIRTIFKRDKEYVNPETGATEDGHWCTLCQDAGIRIRSCFFLGSVTFLRNHIACNAGHVKIYTERCKKLGIVTNERVYAKSDSLESIG